MANLIYNEQQLITVFNDFIKEVIERAAKDGLEKMIDIVNEDWYLASPYKTNDNYERTYQFLKSFVASELSKDGKWMEKAIYSNSESIYPIYKKNTAEGEWSNKHMSLDGSVSYGGQSISSLLVDWIEEGQKSRVKSFDEGIHMFEKTFEWLGTHLPKVIRETALKRGLLAIRTN